MTHETSLPTPAETSRGSCWSLVVVILLALASCNDQTPTPSRARRAPARKALVPVPTTEIATWQRMGSVTTPEGRFLQAVAFDEKRKVVVMFGGAKQQEGESAAMPTQELWEWSPATGVWTLRPPSGAAPSARSGAAMVFDPVRDKMLLFGGRGANHYNCEDLWEWDPPTGTWTERSGAGRHPSARTQQGMVYEASTGKILLYGGGRSEDDVQGVGVVASFGDTWELDPAMGTWTELDPASSPGIRHDFGLVWDSARSKAVLFGGIQISGFTDSGTVMQDTWEWDPAAHTWTERTAAGSQPGQRHGHAMAFDGSRDKVVVFGGMSEPKAETMNDLWDWDPGTDEWTQVLSGAEADVPVARGFASMVFDASRARLELIFGRLSLPREGRPESRYFVASGEVWELDPGIASFTDRSTDYPVPRVRSRHAMAYSPDTGKTYVFGGYDPHVSGGGELADLWEWDGASWTKVVMDTSPPQRLNAAMAYDPVRKSLILFGGVTGTDFNDHDTGGELYDDTWEWSPATRQWQQMVSQGGPAPRSGHAMVTDTTRGKILMFGGSVSTPEGAAEVWEWDGAALTWTDRSPADSSGVPGGRTFPAISFDEGLGKLIVYDSNYLAGTSQSSTSFWAWDVVTGGWDFHDLSDKLAGSRPMIYAVYDSARRRHVFFPDVVENGIGQTWELDAKSLKWYVRSLPSTPGGRYGSSMIYDGARRAVVLFGGDRNVGGADNETWEYTVTNLANGEGCTAASAATCASGNCVDGVCCESPGCTGACMSCSVSGSEGTCVLAPAGTEVPGSCAAGEACDGAGSCKTKNGQACPAASGCASGFCVDGVCCDGECGGVCQACNLAGRIGTCAAHVAGTDPEGECGEGTGVCKSTCDGVGACKFPLVSCDDCLTCDGAGTCSRPVPRCFSGSGGAGGMSGVGSAAGGGSGSGGYPGGSGGGISGGGRGGGSTGSGNGGTTTTGSSGGGGTMLSGAGGLGDSMGSSRGGASGSAGGVGTAADAGAANHDGGDARKLVASLRRGGCSCEVGRGNDGVLPWLLLVGAALLARRARRRS